MTQGLAPGRRSEKAVVEASKQRWREEVWRALEDAKAALFPGARGRIPNFRGAAEAAAKLAAAPQWQRARTLKCNPDSPQKPLRALALREGKTIYVAVPRLRETRCFLELAPQRILQIAAAVTIEGAARFGRPVHPRDMPHIDLVICGSVAVDKDGRRLGKGGGYSDLEFALGRELGFIDARTPIATTLHPLQLVTGPLPVTKHDFSIDLVATPEELLRFKPRARPSGILKSDLTPDLIEAIPILRELGYSHTTNAS
jgi:5-formyltetrahydrofolate cyclo-ligase